MTIQTPNAPEDKLWTPQQDLYASTTQAGWTPGSVSDREPQTGRLPASQSKRAVEGHIRDFFVRAENDFGSTEEYIIGGKLAIPYRAPVGLVAKGQTGKSLLGQDGLLSVATGKDFLGQPVKVKDGTAMYVDFEQRDLVAFRRFKKLAQGAGIDMAALNERIAYVNHQKSGKTLPDAMPELKRIGERLRPDFIVIDGWFSAFRREFNEGHEVLEAFGTITPLLEWGTLFILFHPSHKGATAKPSQMRPSGHQQQFDQPRKLFGLKATSAPNVLKWAVSKQNDDAPASDQPLVIRREDTPDGRGLRHVLLDDQANEQPPLSINVPKKVVEKKTREKKPVMPSARHVAGRIARLDATKFYQAVVKESGYSDRTVRRRLNEGGGFDQLVDEGLIRIDDSAPGNSKAIIGKGHRD